MKAYAGHVRYARNTRQQSVQLPVGQHQRVATAEDDLMKGRFVFHLAEGVFPAFG
jgi:hypothetical protein